MLMYLYAALAIFSLIYFITLKALNPGTTIMEPVIFVIVSAAMLVINKIYYGKRADLFVN